MDFSDAWLKYNKISFHNKSELILYCNTEGRIITNAINELVIGFMRMYERKVILVSNEDSYIYAGSSICIQLNTSMPIGNEGYKIDCIEGKCTIFATSEAGALYGVFALLRNLSILQVVDYDIWTYKEDKEPYNPLRMLNHWDNMDGTIERGYSGNSFFFSNNDIIIDKRTKAFARMAASVGINLVTINNVNVKGAATELISDIYYDKLQRLSEIFYSYGIKIFLCINFAAPMELGELDTADPCNEEVQNWWKKKADEIWKNIPDIGGFLIKADSEGRPGPFTYGRTHPDGANMLAEAVKPHGGLIIWRCFVYNCQQDWRETKTDRACASYDNFMPLDGNFSDHVVLQIKNGPMDFQVREPVSPLFGGLQKTNMMLEVQIAQEYTGQQRHVCYLIPWFKEILNFNTYCSNNHGTVAEIISGKTYKNKHCGIAAVSNTGNDYNWTGHDLAAANLYGFGRLAFDNDLTSENIANEWIIQTFGNKDMVKENILKILMMSWPAYEKYTSPLGIGWMIKPGEHYGPDVDGYEYGIHGTYHKADHKGIGVIRTENGTGFCSQYNEPLASIYSDIKTCPEELLLFFHHVDYLHVLSSGKTVIQHIYDTHFVGAKEAEQFLALWKELQGLIDEDAFQRALDRLQHQKEHAVEWCDVINSYFYRKTGIADQHGRRLY